MLLLRAAAVVAVSVLSAACSRASAQTPAHVMSAWSDPAAWKAAKYTETDNIVFATVPRVPNPSAAASPDPGLPTGNRRPVPNHGPAGTVDLHLDLYRVSSDKPTPVVVQIHGGGWIRGDRPDSPRGFEALLAAGASVVTVQYRNAIDAPAPGAIEDVRCALAWVKASAKTRNFDLSRVVVMGGSAGGHLALMAAYAPAKFTPAGCRDQPRIAAVLDDYGPTNLAEGLTQHGSYDFTHQWLGLDLPLTPEPPEPSAAGTPRPKARWPEPTAALLGKARVMSPLTYVRPGLPPTFILYGDSDPTVDPSQSVELKKALDAAHVPNEQYVVAGGKHGGFPPAENERATLASLRFLKAHGIIQ